MVEAVGGLVGFLALREVWLTIACDGHRIDQRQPCAACPRAVNTCQHLYLDADGSASSTSTAWHDSTSPGPR